MRITVVKSCILSPALPQRESTDYYITVMENICKKGWEFVEREQERLNKGIARAFEDVVEANEVSQVSKIMILRRCLAITAAFLPIPIKEPRPGHTLLVREAD